MCDSPRIGIVIPVYQTRFLRSIVRSVKATADDDVVFCIANDGRPEVDRAVSRMELPSNVAYLSSDHRRHFAGINNFGWRYLTSLYPESLRYLGSLNDDTKPQPGWLESMLAALCSHEDAGLAMPVMLQRRRRFGCKRPVGVWRIIRRSHMEVAIPDPKEITYTIALNGFCFIARRSTIEQVGGFDEEYVNGCEDLDLGIKIVVGGHKMVVCPASRVFHIGGATRDRVRQTGTADENHARFERKWSDVVALLTETP